MTELTMVEKVLPQILSSPRAPVAGCKLRMTAADSIKRSQAFIGFRTIVYPCFHCIISVR